MTSTFEPASRSFVTKAGFQGESVRAKQSDAFSRLDDAGRPLLRLKRYNEEIWLIDADNLLVNPAKRGMRQLGVFGFSTRGLRFYKPAAKAGDFSPGNEVELVREPRNEHDKNAVGVWAIGGSSRAGFVNKGMAPAIAKMINRGDDLVTMCLRGTPAGVTPHNVTVIVTTHSLLEHLARDL